MNIEWSEHGGLAKEQRRCLVISDFQDNEPGEKGRRAMGAMLAARILRMRRNATWTLYSRCLSPFGEHESDDRFPPHPISVCIRLTEEADQQVQIVSRALPQERWNEDRSASLSTLYEGEREGDWIGDISLSLRGKIAPIPPRKVQPYFDFKVEWCAKLMVVESSLQFLGVLNTENEFQFQLDDAKIARKTAIFSIDSLERI